jgi:hypothetical protein
VNTVLKLSFASAILFVAVIGLPGCGSSNSGPADGGADAGMDGGLTWLDPSTNFVWQKWPPAEAKSWQSAVDYCTGLTLGGMTGWRLPTISELRTIIRGCPATQTGGDCGVVDPGCLGPTCRTGACEGCEGGKGPANGCYWDLSLAGSCGWFWSSSPYDGGANSAWPIGFDYGRVLNNYKASSYDVRCVRGP